MIEVLFEDEVPPPRPDGFKPFRLDEEPDEDVEDEPRCRRDGAGAVPSAGRGGDAEDLEKLGTGNESTILSKKRCYIVGAEVESDRNKLFVEGKNEGSRHRGYIRRCCLRSL